MKFFARLVGTSEGMRSESFSGFESLLAQISRD
jgi:hypothetical protein